MTDHLLEVIRDPLRHHMVDWVIRRMVEVSIDRLYVCQEAREYLLATTVEAILNECTAMVANEIAKKISEAERLEAEAEAAAWGGY